MARRANPSLQKAKGNPGRRKSKTDRQLEAAQRVAELLAAAPAEANDPLAPPKFLDQRFAPALQVWREYAPLLAKTHRLQPQHRIHFAMFCVYVGEWMAATEEITANGYQQKVKTVAGGWLWRTKPAVAWREIAFDNAVKLGSQFGLTPSEEYALFKDQALAAVQNPGLFDRQEKPAAAAETAPAGGLIGSMGRLDSAPPERKPN